jgi:hypothetical protein
MDACGSFSAYCKDNFTEQVEVRPILAELGGGIAVTLSSGVEMTATEDASGALNITNSGNQGMITVEFNEQTQNLGPEGSVDVIKIDIKPGSYPNSIKLKSKNLKPVAVLSSDEFNATTVDPDTVVFTGAEPVKWKIKDVDGDCDEDLLFHFKTHELASNQDSIEAILTGEKIVHNVTVATDII